jgi:hypothetical protein
LACRNGASRGGIKNLPYLKRPSQIVRDGAARLGIQFGEVAEAAAAHQRSGDGVAIHQSLADSRALIVAEDKSLVPLDRSASGEAKLILAKLASPDTGGIVEEIRSVELIVTEELPDIAMKLVRSAL